jgi:hypothetical protein
MGGAVYSYAQCNITNCNFTDNKADHSGGALGLNGDSNISNTNFKNNGAGDGSNDIVTTSNATVTLKNVSPDNVTPLTQVNLTIILVNNVTYPNTVEINVNVTENRKELNEGSVYAVINNKTYTADVVNGTATIKISGLDACDYKDVKVTYNGSEKYAKSFQMANFSVLKLGTAITASDNTYVINYGGKYSLTIKDSEGKVVSGKTVTITINGKNYKAKTNKNGQATFKITNLNKKAIFIYVVRFKGDKYYYAVKNSGRIRVI